jgi:nucleoside 2-deoxyribosyltransferase
MSYKIYLAGPIAGLKYDDAVSWRVEAEHKLANYGIQGLSPIRQELHLEGEDRIEHFYNENPVYTAKGITAKDRNDVLTSDLIIAYLLGAEAVSIGTCIEFGWADAWRKPVIMVADDHDIHAQHGMLSEIAGFRVGSVDSAVELAASLLGAERQPEPGEIYAA